METIPPQDDSGSAQTARNLPRIADWLSHHRILICGLIVAAWTIVAVLHVVRLDGRSIDDYFITYRYSQNLVMGNGFVFNPGERLFGTTAPGYGLFLALLHILLRIPVHVLGTASTGFALVLLAGILLWESQRNGRMAEGVLGGSWLVSCGYLWLFHGSETPVALALLVTAAILAARNPLASGLLAGLAVWFRPESLLAVGCLIVLVWIEKRRPPWRILASSAMAIFGGVLAAWWWFGQPLPVTLSAKQAQAGSSLGIWKSGLGFWSAATKHFGTGYADPITLVLVFAGLAGLVLLIKIKSLAFRMLALNVLGLLIAYPALGVAFYPWYSIPVVVVMLYGVGYLAVGAGRAASSKLTRPTIRTAVAVVVTVALLTPVILTLAPRSARQFRHFKVYSLRHKLYSEAGIWLRENTDPGAEIGYIEVGTIAYWSQRPIHDYLGLVSPSSLDFVSRGDIVGAVLEHPAEYMIRHSRVRMLEQAYKTPWFDEHYVEVADFALSGGLEALRIYRRRDGSPMQGEHIAASPSPDQPSTSGPEN